MRAAEVPLPRGTIASGEVRDLGELTEALRQLWKEGRFSTRGVNIGMASQQTLVRQVDLPWEPEEVFRESLPFRVGQEFPVDPLEMTLDYYPLELRQVGPVRQQRALIVAALNASVENTADAVIAAKLRVRRADFAPFALIRAAVAAAGDGSPVPGPILPGEERECEVIVEVGGQMTIIVVHDNGRPLYVRLINAGSDSVTRALGDHLQVRAEVADALKRSLGIAAVGADASLWQGEIGPENIPVAQQIINVMAGSLVQSVRESVEYFLAASPQISGVRRVLLSGGGALLPGYADRLASELRAPIGLLACMNAFATEKSGFAELDPRMNVAFGLALGV